jgi:hypothetical protein
MSDPKIILSANSNTQRSCYHTDTTCPIVQQMNRTMLKPLSVLADHFDHCDHCSGDVATPDPTWSGEERTPSTPTTRRSDPLKVGQIWTADRGFVRPD